MPIGVFFLRFNRIREKKYLWVIFIYVLLSFSSDITLVYYITPEKYTLKQITLFVILETLLFSTYLISIIQSHRLKAYFSAVLAAFFCFSIIYFLFFDENKVYPVLASLESIIIIIFCIVVLFEQITHPQSIFIYSTSSFWIMTGILFYLSGIFFLSLVYPLLSREEANKYWVLNLGFNILKNILFTIAFMVRNSTSNDSLFPKSQAYKI